MMNFNARGNALPGGNTRLFVSPVGACIRNIAVTGELSMKRARVFTGTGLCCSEHDGEARAQSRIKMHAGMVAHETINCWNIRASPGVDQS